MVGIEAVLAIGWLVSSPREPANDEAAKLERVCHYRVGQRLELARSIVSPFAEDAEMQCRVEADTPVMVTARWRSDDEPAYRFVLIGDDGRPSTLWNTASQSDLREPADSPASPLLGQLRLLVDRWRI